MTNELGGHQQSTAAVCLRDYLRYLDNWPAEPKFDREKFRNWLLSDTHVAGAYGLDYVFGGLDLLVRSGHIKRTVSTLLEVMTPEFVDVMQRY